MTYNANKAIAEARTWFHKATYSMDWDKRDGVSKNGTTYFDCSGFVYHLLNVAGAIDSSYKNRTHYTGTLKADLESLGFVEVSGAKTQAGDIYVWGANYGAGAGGVSHTGIMTGNNTQISSSWYTSGQTNEAVIELNHDYYWGLDGKPEAHFFHYQGKTPAKTTKKPKPVSVAKKPATKSAIQQFKDAGDVLSFDKFKWPITSRGSYGGIKQVISTTLTGTGSTYLTNGVPESLIKISRDGKTFTFKQNDWKITKYDTKTNAIQITLPSKFDYKVNGKVVHSVIWLLADPVLKA